MPEVLPIISTAPIQNDLWTVDVKVHMLMPNQWPCIPNWHRDNIPRDHGMVELEELIDTNQKMYFWLSGPPITEFTDGRPVLPCQWIEFTQADWHRGVASDCFTWRVFIRLTPSTILKPNTNSEEIIRRHSQVYLDSQQFTW